MTDLIVGDDTNSSLTESLLLSNDNNTTQQTELEKKVPTSSAAAEVVALIEEGEGADVSPVELASLQRGVRQPPKYRDVTFAVLFYLQFITIIFLAILDGFPCIRKLLISEDMVPTDDATKEAEEEFKNDLKKLLGKYSLVSLAAMGWTTALIFAALIIMIKFAKVFVKISVWFSACTSVVASIGFFLKGNNGAGIFALFCGLMGVCYAYRVRNRIPFAAANLSVGTKAIQSNGGILFVPFVVQTILIGWTILWAVSLIGILDIESVEAKCEDGFSSPCYDYQLHGSQAWIYVWIMLLFWTQQVFKNVIHTSVAGVIGTWYFDPIEAQSCFSPAIQYSLARTLSYSFGSVCLGSLLVSIVDFLKFLLDQTRNQDGRSNGVVLCIVSCLMGILENLLEYFNKWAFIYVGLYGYKYQVAGTLVMTLFKERGWTVLINDHLVAHVLGFMVFTIGLFSALFGVFCFPDAEVAPFLSLLIGCILSVSIMGVIDSSVSTIIVCFAEASQTLQSNHPNHYSDMKQAWERIYQVEGI